MLYKIKDSKNEDMHTTRIKPRVIRNGVHIGKAVPQVGDLLQLKCNSKCTKGASCPNIHELAVVEYVKVIVK